MFPQSSSYKEQNLITFEEQLGFSIPDSIKWFLLNGEGGIGIENFDDSVKLTLDCRKSINLPTNILILNDWGDSGVVFLILETPQEYKIVWSHEHELIEYIETRSIPENADIYKNFYKWLKNCIQLEDDF
ncbi:MAG: SMI1/KNR4 family protein [Flavobacterium sp.]|nr:SMI1/KNR4 family protein [Flavobacterium sp.]